MNNEELLKLAEKISIGKVSDEEIARYNAWYSSVTVENDSASQALGNADLKEAQLFSQIQAKISRRKTKKIWPLYSGIAAAAAMILFTVWIYFVPSQVDKKVAKQYKQDFTPGKIAATLLLSNGQSIRLSDDSQGTIAKDNGVTITKTTDGQIVYHLKNVNASANTLNTLATAKGETFAIVLPDQSKVWLNATSKLTYPTNLSANRYRTVKLEGEAYFEVSKDKMHPFIVETNGQQIKVLGTHFNVSAYSDDAATQTTLLEGRVQVVSNLGNHAILTPGQEASQSKGIINVQQVNAAEAIAWKNGEFVFNDEPLESIMRKIARWYNLEVEYKDESVRNKLFSGGISKFANVSDVLRMLQLTKDVQFEIRERRIIVKK
ncbi:FecR family protein [Pedobacter sp. KBS0701]|uniref:FecR family protein n=1 Tax=unclassified Pedobacter TaxID=2628915 RepID=UPI00110F1EDF|nr:FecR domain-containing protein [Pedobacter sp. KBS0701]QDW27912.1 DUF4974 domain-containing protein [Pedobacter sp. KBS0701]